MSLHSHREQDEEAEKTWTRDGILGVCFSVSPDTRHAGCWNARKSIWGAVFASRKARPEDADPPTKLKLMSFPVQGLSRPPLLLTRVRHSSSPLRRPRLLGNWYALLAALLTLRASGGSCAHRSWISLAQ